MIIKRILALTGFLLISATALGQSADEYFHNSSNAYIDGQFEQAKRTVQEGLLRYPDDPRLQALLKQLRKEQEQQQQQNQQQQQQNQEQQQQRDQQQQNQQQNQQQQQGEQNQPENTGDPQNNEQQLAQQMSKQEAEKILKALEQKEKDLLKQFKKKKTKSGNTSNEKDW